MIYSVCQQMSDNTRHELGQFASLDAAKEYAKAMTSAYTEITFIVMQVIPL